MTMVAIQNAEAEGRRFGTALFDRHEAAENDRFDREPDAVFEFDPAMAAWRGLVDQVRDHARLMAMGGRPLIEAASFEAAACLAILTGVQSFLEQLAVRIDRSGGDGSGIREFAVFRAHGYLVGASQPIGMGRMMAAREVRRLPGYVPLTSPRHPHWRAPDPRKAIGKGLAFMLAHAEKLFENPPRHMMAQANRRSR